MSFDLQALISEQIQAHQVPAMAVAIILDGKVAETVCAGERSFGSGVSVTLDDLWAFGSIGKGMTALLAARLIEKGQLSWSTTIQDIYPELKTSIRPEYCSVTIEDLMLHIGGTPIDDIVVRQEIKEIFLSGLPLQQARRAFVEASLACEPVAPIGQESIYSNSGITVAGAMMEEITGKPWEQIVREEVLDPLGLDTMGFGVPGHAGELSQPRGHFTRQDGQPQSIEPTGYNTPTLFVAGEWSDFDEIPPDLPSVMGPAGAVYGSMADLCTYACVNLAVAIGDEASLLPHDAFSKIHQSSAARGAQQPEGGEMAMGWARVLSKHGHTELITNGSNGRWQSAITLIPEQNCGMVVLSNIYSDASNSVLQAVGKEVWPRHFEIG